MTKKKPSPQNRIWEKERRERLNKTFDDLQRLLPEHEPASTLSKVEILQRAIEHINKLQKKIKTLVEECHDPLKDHVKEQEVRLKRLLVRNEELAELLRKAKITVPPCKYTIAADDCQQQSEEKENGNGHKKTVQRQRRAGAAGKKQRTVIENQPPASVASTEAVGLSIVKSIPPPTSGTESSGISCSSASNTMPAPCPPTLRNINGIPPSNGVNVTPALLPTPIMTTSVIISNNGNLVQVPIVAPPSSLLIVGNEDIRSKINLKNRAQDGNPSRYRGKRGKFTIKSIDLIPGRIVNGKIPIPPLRRSTNDSLKSAKAAPRLKRKRMLEKGGKRLRKSSTSTGSTKQDKAHSDSSKAKRARLQGQGKCQNGEAPTKEDGAAQQKQHENVLETSAQQPNQCVVVPTAMKILPKEQDHTKVHPNETEPTQDTHLDISLNQADLSEDIFANLHVGPDGSNVHGGNEDGTLSPTAAYLMNFPLVAGGGKAAGNHADTGEADECHDATGPMDHQQSGSANKANNVANEQTGSLLLDNFSSFFNYGHIDTTLGTTAPTVGGLPDITTLHSIPTLTGGNAGTHAATTIGTGSSRENTFTNYPTIYQSIDNMLDCRPVAPNRSVIGASANRALPTESDFNGSGTFTFTLTSNTCTAPTTVQSSIGSGHFYGPSCGTLNPVKPVDEFSSPMKPSIEFTFSLTSTTASQPKTVQSQYTNSTILATTMTTPSYDTYGYFHKTVAKPSNYCASFNVLDPLLSTEKPATSFTFSLTSSTKTEPSYTQSTIVTGPTNTTQTYGTPPKLSTKPQQQDHQQQQQQQTVAVDIFPAKQEAVAKPEKPRTAPKTHMENSTARSDPSNGLQQQQQQQQQLQSQQQTQSKYDVSWMATGVHQGQLTNASSQNSQQQTQLQSHYETIPSQIIPPIEFPPAGGYTSTNNYKSDIFFAHPPGEEHNLTWSSPSKLSNILNDSSSPYFPPVTLPSLNGDLALNTSGGGNVLGGSTACTGNKMNTASSCKVAKKAYPQSSSAIGAGQAGESSTGGSFLSVSQLVNEPSKSYAANGHSMSNGGVCQKSTNNIYSAEALIGHSYTHSATVGLEGGRKDKLFEYGASTLDSGSAPLTFNFDTYATNGAGVDYNKGYNFGNQQNGYMASSYGDSAYSTGSSSCGASNAPSAIPYYGKTSASQGYYCQTNLEGTLMELGSTSSTVTNYPNPTHGQPAVSASTMGQEYTTPYYLPSFGEKKQPSSTTQPSGSTEQTSAKSKKNHKTAAVAAAVEFVFNTTVASTIATTITSSSSSSYNYNASANATITSAGSIGHSVPQTDPSSYPNYHLHHHHHSSRHHNYHHLQPTHPSGSVASDTSSSATRKTSSAATASSTTTTTTTTSSYNYNGQYLSTKAPQQTHFDASHQPSYSHAHHLSMAPCINPTPGVGYGSGQSATSQPAYGQSASHEGQQHHYRQPSQVVHHHHHHHQQQQEQQHQQQQSVTSSSSSIPNSSSSSSSTITNFNLSTICPEINEKTARSREGPLRSGVVEPGALRVPSSVASIVPHW
ncbi:mucin-19-like [Anopheles merus]|uniref:mucin-19-like n=1 Tax=Anopheles merus TaxID=30066 RepID=UPI001BE457B6|nr:mucin-19-like [Anopheles merus]XP_041784263.1 mucin-19-like [Anopheles merus]XP_041784265.1 mucin-19-like [Anopheles merus]